MNESSRNKCLLEIQLLQSLRHPHIIRYEDSYIDSQTSELVIVLQWARGGDLKKLLKKVKSGQAKINEFSESMIWKYCMELASGLEYMHSKRVMHRDLKPAVSQRTFGFTSSLAQCCRFFSSSANSIPPTVVIIFCFTFFFIVPVCVCRTLCLPTTITFFWLILVCLVT